MYEDETAKTKTIEELYDEMSASSSVHAQTVSHEKLVAELASILWNTRKHVGRPEKQRLLAEDIGVVLFACLRILEQMGMYLPMRGIVLKSAEKPQ